jgi:hypothetical protein
MVDSNLGHLSLSRDWQCSGLTRCCIKTVKTATAAAEWTSTARSPQVSM